MSTRQCYLSPYKLKQSLAYVREHLGEQVTVTALARVGGMMSRSHFIRGFKRAMGITPYKYIVHCRIERAKRLLRETSLPLDQVAHAVGFSDQSHLTKRFRLAVKITPKIFREW